ncbi:MAG TPA: EAL domain-containing protein [Candidatus Bathyarchaeia archaeon]|nr:EAL domain-containing protein [Candidatus Bathyarchaeia archaeon]
MDIYVARQPILDRRRRTVAYELLFRDGLTNAFGVEDPDRATARVIDTAFFVMGAETLTGGRRAFVNFTRESLVGGHAGALPGRLLVVEILEDVPVDAEVLRACRALKLEGCGIALDDVVTTALPPELVDLADIVKVDFSKTTPVERRDMVATLRGPRIRMLAEKVETDEEFQLALDSGYDYFQGYFFARPSIVAGRAIAPSKLNILNLVREVHRPDLVHARVEDIIKHEVSFALKLLTRLRSSAWGLRRPVESVQHAILFLGDHALRKWASVVALAALGEDHPSELAVASVVRASFCEGLLLALDRAEQVQDGFFLGLFSMIDAFLGVPLSEAIERLPLSEAVRAALLGGDNLLRRVLEVVLAWERGDWAAVALASSRLGLPSDAISARYASALEFANAAAVIQTSAPTHA